MCIKPVSYSYESISKAEIAGPALWENTCIWGTVPSRASSPILVMAGQWRQEERGTDGLEST